MLHCPGNHDNFKKKKKGDRLGCGSMQTAPLAAGGPGSIPTTARTSSLSRRSTGAIFFLNIFNLWSVESGVEPADTEDRQQSREALGCEASTGGGTTEPPRVGPERFQKAGAEERDTPKTQSSPTPNVLSLSGHVPAYALAFVFLRGTQAWQGKEPEGARKGLGAGGSSHGPRLLLRRLWAHWESPPLQGGIFKLHVHHGKWRAAPLDQGSAKGPERDRETAVNSTWQSLG